MTFRVGQKVACVDARLTGGCLVDKQVYTVLYTNPHWGIVGVDCPPLNDMEGNRGWLASRFRAVVERSTETGMAVLQEILRTVGDRTRVSKPAGVA